MPLQRRIPKRGFTPRRRTVYQIVNVADLARVEGTTVNAETLSDAGLIRSTKGLVKVLAMGELSQAYAVEAHKFSAGAVAKIEAAGGSVSIVVSAASHAPDAPAEAEEPQAASDAPAEAEEPQAASDAPAEAEEPQAATDAPAETDEPQAATDAPAEADEAEASADASTETKESAATDEPEAVDEPVAADESAASDQPVASAEPTATDDPAVPAEGGDQTKAKNDG